MKIRSIAVATGVLVAFLAPAASTPAQAIDQTKGYAGPCVGNDAATGVTVVVDFQEIDGNGGNAAPTITRCSPNPTPGTDRTGVKALQDAGLSIAGTQQYGLAFICRIEGRPSATETLPNGHKETCGRTPPATAYWGYWHANGTTSTWTYSSYGAANRKVVPGGFEGWSFSMNRSSSTNPPPEVTPLNPSANANATRAALQVDDLDRTIAVGQSTTLTWSTQNATSVRSSGTVPSTGGGSWPANGTLAINGTRTITPTSPGTYTYTLTARGPNGTTTTSATLTVTS